jgi:hypothetical protein
MGTTYSIFTVGYSLSTGGYCRLLNGGGYTADALIYFGSTDGNNSDFAGNNTWNEVSSNSPAMSSGAWYIKEVTNNGSSLIPYYNGTAQNSKNGNTLSFTGMSMGGFLHGQYWNGYIAEVLIYSRVLSQTERQTTEGYLAVKWGLTSSLPVSHPYYVAPPLQITTANLALYLDAGNPSSYSSGTTWTDTIGNVPFTLQNGASYSSEN